MYVQPSSEVLDSHGSLDSGIAPLNFKIVRLVKFYKEGVFLAPLNVPLNLLLKNYFTASITDS